MCVYFYLFFRPKKLDDEIEDLKFGIVPALPSSDLVGEIMEADSSPDASEEAACSQVDVGPDVFLCDNNNSDMKPLIKPYEPSFIKKRNCCPKPECNRRYEKQADLRLHIAR